MALGDPFSSVLEATQRNRLQNQQNLMNLVTLLVGEQQKKREMEMEEVAKSRLMEKEYNIKSRQEIEKQKQFQEFIKNVIPGLGGNIGFTGFTADPISGEVRMAFGETSEAKKAKEIETIKEKKEAEKELEIKETVGEFKGFIEQFERSNDELIKAYPNIGAKGIAGFGTRMLAKGQEKLGYFPETSAFLREIKPMANKMARTIEGGRVTDEDRKIYAESLANALSAPTETNIRLASNVLVNAYRKGGNIIPVMDILKSSKNEILQGIVKEVEKTDYRNMQRTEIPSYNPKTHKLQQNSKTGEYRVIPR